MNFIVYRSPDAPSTPGHWMAGFILAILAFGSCALVAFYYGSTTEVTPENSAKLAQLRTIGLIFSGMIAAVIAVWWACRKWLW